MSIIKWKESYRVARQKKGNYNKIGNDTVPLMIQTQETKRDSVDQSRYPSERWKGEDFWVSHFNYDPEVLGRIHFPEEVIFHDVTLRDGEQTPGVVLRTKEKVDIATMLDEVGVQRIEAGMPVVSKEDFDAVREIAHLGLQAKVFAFSRLVKEDIEAALKCDVQGIICEGPVGIPKLMQFGWKNDQVVQKAVEAIDYAKKHGLWTAYFGVDGTRADLSFLKRLMKTISEEAHPDAFVIVDTFGCASPEAFGNLVREIRKTVREPLEVHTHNDFGLGVATSIAGLQNGASVVHTSVNGIGERAGNASFEEVAMALKYLYGQPVKLDFSRFKELSEIVRKYTSFPLAPNKAVVGDRVFTREAGISIAGWMKFNLGSEAYLPEVVGNKHGVFLGKKSGRHSIEWKLKELGLEATEEQMTHILAEVKRRSEERKGNIDDREFLEIYNSITRP
jgi:isopropylmalate/homocitrate/citramalate synthase